jgi:hypothetical protein
MMTLTLQASTRLPGLVIRSGPVSVKDPFR